MELHRRLGEVGRPRLGPRLVDFVLQERLASTGPNIAILEEEDVVLYALAKAPENEVQSVIEQKLDVYRIAMRLKDSPPKLELLHRMLLLSKVSSGLTSLQISASRASAGELPEPTGADDAEESPMLNKAMEE